MMATAAERRRVGHAALEERLSVSKGEKPSHALHHSPGENTNLVATRGQSMPEPSPQQPHDPATPPIGDPPDTYRPKQPPAPQKPA